MFGKDRELVNKIEQLSAEKEQLKQENERLKRCQLGGSAAVFAQTFDEKVNDWIEGDYIVTDVHSGVSAHGMDAVIDSAFRHAVEAFSEVTAERKVELIKQTLPESTVSELAVRGLTKVLNDKPEIISQFLNQNEITMVVESLTADKEQRELILSKLTQPDIETQDIISLQKELDTYGHFSTDRLPEGARISIDFMYKTGLYSHSLTGRVLKTSDGQHWISVIEDSRNSSNQGKFTRGGIEAHTLLRFGHVDGEGKLVAAIVPGTDTQPIYKDPASTQSIVPYYVQEFFMNDTELQLNAD